MYISQKYCFFVCNSRSLTFLNDKLYRIDTPWESDNETPLENETIPRNLTMGIYNGGEVWDL